MLGLPACGCVCVLASWTRWLKVSREKDRFLPLEASTELLELEPGRFQQEGAAAQFQWVAPFGADLFGVRFSSITPGREWAINPRFQSWIVERLELDGENQLVDATPLVLLLSNPDAPLMRVRPAQVLHIVVRLGALEAQWKADPPVYATHAVLQVAPL